MKAVTFSLVADSSVAGQDVHNLHLNGQGHVPLPSRP